MWIYVIINSELPNILTEKCILQDFILKGGLNENDFILMLFIQAMESFRLDGLSSNRPNFITPIIIQTQSTISETPGETYPRSQSLYSIKTNSTSNLPDAGLFSSVTSTFKGIFK
jgi:hypothetical protein